MKSIPVLVRICFVSLFAGKYLVSCTGLGAYYADEPKSASKSDIDDLPANFASKESNSEIEKSMLNLIRIAEKIIAKEMTATTSIPVTPDPITEDQSPPSKMMKKVRSRLGRIYSHIYSGAKLFDHMFLKFQNFPEERLAILTDLEDMIHQYDAGRDFAASGGLNILFSVFDSSDENLIALSLLLIGSAVQSNPDVQKIAYDVQLEDQLMPFFDHKSEVIVSRALYALSGYLRRYPMAQQRFIEKKGFNLLSDILNSPASTVKVKNKVINIISDLVAELNEASEHGDFDNVGQYVRIPLEKEIQAYDFCSSIPRSLYEDDFDTQQKVVAAMNNLLSLCSSHFAHDTVYVRIKSLHDHYGPKMNKDYSHTDNSVDLGQDAFLNIAMYKDLSALINAISVSKTKRDIKDDL